MEKSQQQKFAQDRAHKAQYPEHAKLRAIAKESQANGHFIEWLNENGMQICKAEEGYSRVHYYPVQTSIQQLLARYHKINLTKLDEEKDAMLNQQRALNELTR
jgi:hypothetical protein